MLGIWMYVRYASLKLMPRFGTPLRNAFARDSAAHWKASSENRKASSENRKVFPKNRKASSEERWVRTRISFRNAVQLRLRIFRVRV